MPYVSSDAASLPMPSLDAVLDAASTVTAVLTSDGRVTHWVGALPAQGDTWFDAMPEGEHFAAHEALSRARGGTEPVVVELNSISWTLTAPEDAGYVIATGIDKAERARIEQRLGDLVDRDGLTGLIGRRRFEDELGRHVAQGRRYGIAGALIVIDLNGFRSINEEHGPRAGDRVLGGVARALGNRLRDTDLLARIGADRFAVLLPRAKPPEAERVCQALEEAIPEEVRAPGGRRVEASMGFVPFTETMNSVDEALLAAHAAMYAVKAGQPRHVRRLRPLD